MNFKQYVDEKRRLYEAFAETLRTIITTVLDSQPSIPRPQQIQARAKSPESLGRKLKERGLERSRSIEREIKDLAGVRLIFYTNTDERAFLNSQIINENFHVDYDASKVHHPVGSPTDVNEQYRGIHYVLTLKEDRLKLPEYTRFAGLRCEIQIQTILNHAWSETAHDILYHRPDVATGFGTKQFERISTRMASIMEKHLKPAGHEFEKVHHDFQRLTAGKALFDQGIVETLSRASDNNERHELLTKIKKDVLPLYDDVTTVATELRDALVELIQQARKTETKKIEYQGFGSFPGKSEADVVEATLEILDYIRYVDTVVSFKALLSLFPGAKSDQERKHILESVKKLAEYNLTVWRKAGSFVQDILVQEVLKLEPSARNESRQVIRCLCEQVLKSEIRGVSSETYDTMSIHTGAVVGTDKLSEIRQKALEVVLDLYDQSASPGEKRECYRAMSAAMALPNIARYEEALWLLVNRDTKSIIEFFTKRGLTEPHGILQDLEGHCFRIFQNAEGVRNTKPQQEAVIASYEEVLPVIGRFRTLINSDETYQKHKTFVGFHPIFEEDLSKADFDWRRRDTTRNARMEKYLDEIDQTTADEWLTLLTQFSAERDAYQHLARFCEMIGINKPQIALAWSNNADIPQSLRIPLLFGILASSEHDRGVALIRQWIQDGTHLGSVARVVRYRKEVPEDLLRSLAEKALSIKDIQALEEIVPSLINRRESLFIDSLLLPAIRALAEAKSWFWLQQMFLDEQEQLFLQDLSENQAKAILESLVELPNIEYQAESFLKCIARAHPSEVLNLFQQREARPKDEGERYEAIPYDLHELHEPLAANPGLVINNIKTWYSADSTLFQFKGGRLLALVFPSFSEAFGIALQTLVKKDPTSVDFVLSVLQNYQGQSALHETFKTIVNLLPEQDERLSTIELALETTGVVSGEFGFVEAYQEKRRAVEPWLEDKRPRVRKFAKRYVRSLDRAIAAEQRRAEADIELRKHQFDPDAE